MRVGRRGCDAWRRRRVAAAQVNNGVIAVVHALATKRIRRAAIVDFDVHLGDGACCAPRPVS